MPGAFIIVSTTLFSTFLTGDNFGFNQENGINYFEFNKPSEWKSFPLEFCPVFVVTAVALAWPQPTEPPRCPECGTVLSDRKFKLYTQ